MSQSQQLLGMTAASSSSILWSGPLSQERAASTARAAGGATFHQTWLYGRDAGM